MLDSCGTYGRERNMPKQERAIHRRSRGIERPSSRHRAVCPKRRRPQHRDSGADASPPQAPTEPLHCIYNLGLGVVAQGGKQVLLGSETIEYGPGQSMLTTIDLPVVSHVTRASVREPFLGMMLTLDVRSIVQIASEIDVPRPRRDDVASIDLVRST